MNSSSSTTTTTTNNNYEANITIPDFEVPIAPISGTYNIAL